MKSKKCFKCNQIKPLSDFYKHSQMADGHLNKCKECNKKDVSANYRDKIDYYKEYDKKRNADRWEYKTVQAREWRKRNPEKYKAQCVLNNAVRSGAIVKKSCVLCGEEMSHGHHHDYKLPLDVIWLCANHHNWLHRALKSTLTDF